MKAITLVGIVLIVLGILALVYQGIPTKSERDVIRIGPVQTSIETKRIIVLPPIVGAWCLPLASCWWPWDSRKSLERSAPLAGVAFKARV